MAPSTNETPVLDLLKDMTAASLDATSLDEQTLMLVRIAALIAVDAPPVSYAMNLEAAAEVRLDPEQVRGVLPGDRPDRRHSASCVRNEQHCEGARPRDRDRGAQQAKFELSATRRTGELINQGGTT